MIVSQTDILLLTASFISAKAAISLLNDLQPPLHTKNGAWIDSIFGVFFFQCLAAIVTTKHRIQLIGLFCFLLAGVDMTLDVMLTSADQTSSSQQSHLPGGEFSPVSYRRLVMHDVEGNKQEIDAGCRMQVPYRDRSQSKKILLRFCPVAFLNLIWA